MTPESKGRELFMLTTASLVGQVFDTSKSGLVLLNRLILLQGSSR